MLNGITIRTRLKLTFGSITILLLAVAAIGINRIALISEGLHTITAESNPELLRAAEMLTTQYQITVHCRTAQSLNQQAANLTQMMSRFQVGSEAGRAPTAVPRTVPSKAPSRPSLPERRGPNRAFAKGAAKPAAKRTPAPPPAPAASGGGDADWQEF